MKRIILALIIISSILGACSKNSNKHNGGSWTFKGKTYQVGFANYVLAAFTAYTVDEYPTGSLAFTFLDTMPAVGTHTYYLSTADPPPPGYVFVRMTDTSRTANYICGNSNSSSITATVSSDRTSTEINVSGITLMRSDNLADSSLLTAHITQINSK